MAGTCRPYLYLPARTAGDFVGIAREHVYGAATYCAEPNDADFYRPQSIQSTNNHTLDNETSGGS